MGVSANWAEYADLTKTWAGSAGEFELADLSLADKYELTEGRVFLSGIQALVRLPLVQSLRDRQAGLHTAGFISGYRGSPLAGLDQQLWRAESHLAGRDIKFQPGVNEELAATAVWGSQQVGRFAGARYDGVYAMWYAKAPGVDRAGDALKHGNAHGTSRHGGVLAVAGDDHACKSSSLPSQSEYCFMDAGIPVLNPAGVQEVLDYGLIGWAMSRYAGVWVAMIALADTMDSSATVDADIGRVRVALPDDFDLPAAGVNLRVGVPPLELEESLHRARLYAALAFARANRLDRVLLDSDTARLGIVTTGKAYLDVLEALHDLGVDEREARRLGLRLYKVGMSWPLDKRGILEFADGLEEILVVEEKRAVIENQIKEQLYNAPTAARPRVVGKFDEHGRWLLPSSADLSPGTIARAIAGRLPERERVGRVGERLAELRRGEAALAAVDDVARRQPFYCSGCPHNSSTKVPEGSRALAGIGCHFMVQWMHRDSETFSQMGGEGVQWTGQMPFTAEPHVFANLGDGTYYHSGILAIRAAVAAGVNITYKLLFNDAVAMTGGQALDGALTVAQITRQLAAEGVARIAIVTDEPARHRDATLLAPGTTVHHRRELDFVQRQLRGVDGCTVIVYDQPCAANLRRRRKREPTLDPPVRVFINEAVCEGCGDCSVQSNCISIEPVETELGRKRQVNQSSCNKDYTCTDGLCPAFVTVHGGKLRDASVVGASADAVLERLPPAQPAAIDEPWNIVIAGVGGTGIVTIGALLGTAAHLEGKAATVLDMTGLSQKGGAVISHVRIARRASDICTPRIPTAMADTLLACDLIVAVSRDAVVKLEASTSQVLVNTHVTPTAEFVMDNDIGYDPAAYLALLERFAHQVSGIDAVALAAAVLGDAVTANVVMLGYALQKGLVPLSLVALERAIELNGTAVEANKRALAWGRMAAHDPSAVSRLVSTPAARTAAPRSLERLVEKRARELEAYQGSALAGRYRGLVEHVRRAEAALGCASDELSRAVADGYFKLLAYKDEYEVARLYTNGEFERRLRECFDGEFTLEVHLAPPLLQRIDAKTGRPRKHAYGGWMLRAMSVLARLRRLRGTFLDPFGYTCERRLERRLVADYEATIALVLAGLSRENHALAVEIASLPGAIRGFAQVKAASAKRALAQQTRLLERFRQAVD